MAEGALTNDLEQIQLWLLEVNKQAIPELQAQLTSYQTLKQELQAQIVKGQELIEDQEKAGPWQSNTSSRGLSGEL